MYSFIIYLFFFFFNDPATTEIYTFPYTTLFRSRKRSPDRFPEWDDSSLLPKKHASSRIGRSCWRSEEHTSELQSHSDLVCRLLLEKKKIKRNRHNIEIKQKKKVNNINNLISDKV